MDPSPQPRHTRAWLLIGIGAALALAGVLVTILTFGDEEISGRRYLAVWGPIVIGLGLALRGISEISTYRSFVAWRYLMIPHPKVLRATEIAVVTLVLVRLGRWAFFGAGLSLRAPISLDLLTLLVLLFVFFLGALVPARKAIGFTLLGVVVARTAWWVVAGEPFSLSISTDVALLVLLTAVIFGGVLVHTRAAAWCFLVGLAVLVVAIAVQWHFGRQLRAPAVAFSPAMTTQVLQIAKPVAGGALVFMFLAMFFGSLRAYFTFYATVPIGGVWIGTAALVVVLSVMSGFETDLRNNILGSHAHIQITREDGDFEDWREVKARIDAIPGVVASTPYAKSEVVIAAHGNGWNVIIKGIDLATVGEVTDLISDLEDPKALDRLEPLIDDTRDLTVPDAPAPEDVIDPAPPDMPSGGEPIDFSGEVGSLDAAPRPLPDEPAIDAPPPDLLSLDAPPADYSAPGVFDDVFDDDLDEGIVRIDVSDTFEPISRRTLSLPGVLVGRELAKQIHLYTGQEVRIVSPLSDPSNPDATGTPIPFNRDYRVAGIFFSGMYEYDLKFVYVTLESLQDFLDLGETVDGIEVRIFDPEQTERFVPGEDGPGLIRQALGPGYRVADWRELNRNLFSALKLEKIAMFLVLGIVILVASFSIIGNLIMVVVEKGREIALLKTLGASDVGIMQLFSLQGMMIGLIGTVLGIATGLTVCWFLERFGLPINADVYYIDKLPVHVDPQSVAAAAAAGVLISIAATLYPALLGARVRPAAGMRH